MGKYPIFAFVAGLLAFSTSAAWAADRFGKDSYSMSPSDWDGFYLGFGGEFKDVTGPGGGKDQIVYAGGYLGANFTNGNFLTGGELFASTYRDLGGFPSSIEVGAEGRAGLLISESIALYVSAGAAYDFQYSWSAIAGAGAEIMVGDGISLDLEYQHGWDLDAPYTSNQLLTSMLFHF